jgi:hypothetical protein
MLMGKDEGITAKRNMEIIDNKPKRRRDIGARDLRDIRDLKDEVLMKRKN